MPQENTRHYARERGSQDGHHHCQSLTGVLFSGEVEQASEILAGIWNTFECPIRGRYLEHRIHDKGDNRSKEVTPCLA